MTPRKTVVLHFGNNVYTEHNKNEIPFDKGIYIAYPGKFNGDYVDLRDPIYIGKGDETPIKERIADHVTKDYKEWMAYCKEGEQIYYRVAELDEEIGDVEAAMIFTHKLPCNSIGVDNYTGDRPAPDVDYDIALPPVDGYLIDVLDINNKINR